ncbi:hypothetical protein CDAR_377071 [Caerostris darwini]|uniref:Uncharacterized protein n=1 Tax=Caerostris darwini TaxID=1538125 RepID=A0AAV4PMN1_9ARAC|nr:hypothetical protein CDAR_377071 [Caerostris darwini]
MKQTSQIELQRNNQLHPKLSITRTHAYITQSSIHMHITSLEDHLPPKFSSVDKSESDSVLSPGGNCTLRSISLPSCLERTTNRQITRH